MAKGCPNLCSEWGASPASSAQQNGGAGGRRLSFLPEADLAALNSTGTLMNSHVIYDEAVATPETMKR